MTKEKDKISRKAFQEPGLSLLSSLLSMDIVKAQSAPMHVRQTIFERETDIVLLLEARDGQELVLHLEFQSKNDSKMVLRMAIYDHILYEEHRKEVFGMVIYIGKPKLTMKNKINFFGNYYSCPIIDIRNIDPQVFISSNQPRQVIFGILAGNGAEDKSFIIQQILAKLQTLTRGSDIELSEYILEMEYLAQGRSITVQEQIKKEVSKMAITFPIEKSLYFQDAVKIVRKNTRLEDATNLIKEGISLDIIRRCTRVSMKELKKIRDSLK